MFLLGRCLNVAVILPIQALEKLTGEPRSEHDWIGCSDDARR
jgi:hypothetical protein